MATPIASLREQLNANQSPFHDHDHDHDHDHGEGQERRKKRLAFRKLSRTTAQRTVDFVMSHVFRAKKHGQRPSSDRSIVSPFGPLREGAKDDTAQVDRSINNASNHSNNNNNHNHNRNNNKRDSTATVGVHRLPSVSRRRSSLSLGLDFVTHGETGMQSQESQESPLPAGCFDILPVELKMRIFSFLGPASLLWYTLVSPEWRSMCLHGSLWKVIDTDELRPFISSDKLLSLIIESGPFVRDLNIRAGEYIIGSPELMNIGHHCTNLTSLAVETTCWYWELQLDIEGFIRVLEHGNPTLRNLALKGSSAALPMGISRAIGKYCTQLRCLDLSRTYHHAGEELGVLSPSALRNIVEQCPNLEELILPYSHFLRNRELLLALHTANKLSILQIADLDVTEEALNLFFHGSPSSYMTLLNPPPPRRLRHLEVSRCNSVSGRALNSIVGLLPDLEIFILKECFVADTSALSNLVFSFSRLRFLALQSIAIDVPFLGMLASAPCTASLEVLEFDDAMLITDNEAIPLIQNCPRLRALRLSETNITDQTLVTVCDKVARAGRGSRPPTFYFHLTVNNCMKVSWAGIQQVLATNSGSYEWSRFLASRAPSHSSSPYPSQDSVRDTIKSEPQCKHPPLYPHQLIRVQCAYNHMVYTALHTNYIIEGEPARALDLERKISAVAMGGVEAKVLRRSPLRLRLKSLVSKVARAEAHRWIALREQINFSRSQCLSLINYEERPDFATTRGVVTEREGDDEDDHDHDVDVDGALI